MLQIIPGSIEYLTNGMIPTAMMILVNTGTKPSSIPAVVFTACAMEANGDLILIMKLTSQHFYWVVRYIQNNFTGLESGFF
jgi:hypothetical protein